MSDSDRLRSLILKESTYGVTPASAMTIMRVTSNLLSSNQETIESEEIRADRVTADVARSRVNVGGDIGFEFHYGTFDALLEATLHADATWTSEDAVTDNTVAVTASATFSGTGEYPTSTYSPGQWVYSSGWTNAANNGWFKILTNPDNDTITVAPGILVTEAAGTGKITKLASEVMNGTTQASFSMEKEFTDITAFESFTGMVPNTLQIGAEEGGRVAGTFNFIGKSGVLAGSTIGTGTPVAANSNKIFGVNDHVLDLHEDGAKLTSLGFSFNMSNNLRARRNVGSKNADSMGSGFISITGTVRRYFSSIALMNKALNFTESSIAMLFYSSSGGGYVIEFPRVHFTNGSIVAQQRGQDIIADMQFTAKAHESEVNLSSPAVPVMVRMARIAA